MFYKELPGRIKQNGKINTLHTIPEVQKYMCVKVLY